MNTIKNLAYFGIAMVIVSMLGMIIAFVGFMTVFASAASSMDSMARPDFTVFIVGFSIAFISGAVGGIVRALLAGMIISKGFQTGRSGIVAFFADIIREADRRQPEKFDDSDFRR